MSKHTPKPWHYAAGYVIAADNGDNITLAEMHSTFGTDNFGDEPLMLGPKERSANGHLMAAAPEMLEALQMFLAYNDQGAPLSFDTDAMWAKARSVVAKIEGGDE